YSVVKTFKAVRHLTDRFLLPILILILFKFLSMEAVPAGSLSSLSFKYKYFRPDDKNCIKIHAIFFKYY
ncbi:MAG: hypothetical protein KDC05_05630, partial [Bacteroidales bacterium]|nr:hypothetical protein [Bacteroidales bacterium]